MNKKNAIFAPHLDDETFGCGGTIVKELRDGNLVSVVYMTDSRNSHLIDLGISENPTPDEVAAERKKEVFAATAELGIPPSNLTFLGLPDGELKKHVVEARRCIRAILLADWPNEIYIPSLEDKHPDHVATNGIVLGAIQGMDHKPMTVYEYTTWISREVGEVQRGTHGGTGEGPSLGTPRADSKKVAHDITGSLAAKNAAIDRYLSQITLHWRSQTRPVRRARYRRQCPSTRRYGS